MEPFRRAICNKKDIALPPFSRESWKNLNTIWAIHNVYGDQATPLTLNLARRLAGQTVYAIFGRKWWLYGTGIKDDRLSFIRQLRLLRVDDYDESHPEKTTISAEYQDYGTVWKTVDLTIDINNNIVTKKFEAIGDTEEYSPVVVFTN